VPPNTTIFLLGLAVGTGLLLIGLLIGYWFGKRSAPDAMNQQQFLSFVRNMSLWTSEFAGDVSKYQTQLSTISKQVEGRTGAPPEEIVGLLSQIMDVNQRLQKRLDDAEKRLESQTHQISCYLTEARTDGLTGLMNRRAFDKSLDELFATWQNKQQSFALGLIDIDHFKKINDTYGHPAGDAVLKHVAQTIHREMNGAACVARYGGEEFAILTLAPLKIAANEIEQLRAVVGQTQVSHEGKIIPVTLSAGVSPILADEKIGKLVRRADEALYAAKSAGRNRVFSHDGRNLQQVTPGSGGGPASQNQSDETRSLESKVQQRLQRIVEEESKRQGTTRV
jgi:diguanylate cyclase